MEEKYHKKIRRWLVVFVLFSLSAFFIYNLMNSSVVIKFSKGAEQKTAPLEKVVLGSLEGTRGIYGIYIKNLSTGESYSINEHKIYEAGSLYKLWVMAETFRQIQSGELQKDKLLSDDISSLNETFGIPPDSAELTEGKISLTVQSALNQMITISHNYAAFLLTKEVKLSKVASFIKNYGFRESVVGVTGSPPTTTPFDIAIFFEKLTKKELANEQYTQEMIELLKNQKLNDKLPKYLPKEVKIAHKTGEIEFSSHDAGIVYSPKGNYIIVVMSDSKSPAGAEERIALLSKAVYSYFTR